MIKIFLTSFFVFLPLINHSYGQKINYIYSHLQNTDKNIREMTVAGQKILITDLPGKKGKEIQDTTINVNSELRLFAGLYNNGKYKSEASVDWFWADTSHTSLIPRDTTVYLGSGTSIIFEPTNTDTGFIFVQDLPNAPGDSTGTIRIIYGEKLMISPVHSDHSEISQGQENIFVSFSVENTGIFSSIIQEANLQFIDVDSQIVTSQYQISRIDTTTIIPAGGTKQFEFLVDANSDADTGVIFIDALLMTEEAFYTNIEPKHQWQVQTPPSLNIDLIDALVEEVFPGQQDIFVVMHVSNRGGASVNNMDANLTFWHSSQDVSDEYECVMDENNPQFIKGDNSARINLVVRVKPSATLGTIVINGNISALDVNSGISYSDEGADLQASWLVTLTTSAQVGIIATTINCPNTDASGNGEVNINQRYIVEVVVRNQGTETVQRIGARLSTDGSSRFLTDPSQVMPSLFKNEVATIKYQLEAYAESIPVVENFTARIDSAISIGGGRASINAALDSLAQVKILYPANLILKLDTTYVQVAVGQTFDVIATVDHSPENAGFDSTGTLSIRLPENYDLAQENTFQKFKEDEKITWKVRSPPFPSGPDTILVYISQKPRDKNNPDEYAQVSIDSAFLIVETLETFINIADIAIVEPRGAIDDTISTDQVFVVRAMINSQKVEDIYAQIMPPENFTVSGNTIKRLNADSVRWQLTASNLTSYNPEQIIVQAWGNIENDTIKVFSQPDSSLFIFTVSKANLKVSAEIISPPSALQGQISPGLRFQIKGEILNLGDAGMYGKRSLKIDVQDTNSFTVIGDTLLSVENEPAIWTIKASDKLDVIPKIIKVKIFDIPYDENSDEQAYVSNENQVADVQVYTGVTNIQLMIRKLPEVEPKIIAPGITETMMGVEFTNFTHDNEIPIQINALKFDIEDKVGNLIAPPSLISGFRIWSDEIIVGEAKSTLHNPIEIPFTIPITLEAQEKEQILVEIDFHENLAQQFQINLKDTSYIDIESLLHVSVIDELRNPKTILNLRSHCPVITENNLKHSFVNYPNPFGTPDRRKTHFVYFLSQDTDVELKIYTLLGELVWSCSYSRNEPQGKKGLHQKDDMVWDTRNSRGYKVLNGVYIARIETNYGEWAITKVAVIK